MSVHFWYYVSMFTLSFVSRNVLQPNKENCNPNVNIAQRLKPLVSSKIAKELIQEKKFKVAQRQIVERFVCQNTVAVESIQSTMDESGISRNGYGFLQKRIATAFKSRGIKPKLLPTISAVWRHRKYLNLKQEDYVGKPYHINGESQAKQGLIFYDEYNNIFMDLEMLQIRMVEFYNISHAETNGVLNFVLKMDECEILKDAKMERVAITLMDRAIVNMPRDDPRYFSVQSEMNLWWVGTFLVASENFETLEWIFWRTQLPNVINAQMRGQKTLVVPNRGSFQVTWHLASDLKTLKCLYNCNRGPVTLPCLYCTEDAKTLDKKWWRKAPNRHQLDKDFKPVFDIPLSNVHICTMHALCRVIEKLVNLYIGFAWKIKNHTERKKAIAALEMFLGDMKLHGGEVQIVQDKKKSNNEVDIPRKVSLGGVKARRFLSRPVDNRRQKLTKRGKYYKTTHVSRIEFEQWKKLHNTVKDQQPLSRHATAEVWRAVDVIFQMMDKETWTSTDKNTFKATLEHFKKEFLKAWEDINVTHYMVREVFGCIHGSIKFVLSTKSCPHTNHTYVQHIIYNHMPYFIDKYGDPSIWSTQGMEKSHYMARNAYFRHTQHGGGSKKANSLCELFQWFYRRTLQILRTKEEISSSAIAQAVRDAKVKKEKRIEAFRNSNALEGLANWRQGRLYQNHRWVKIPEVTSQIHDILQP